MPCAMRGCILCCLKTVLPPDAVSCASRSTVYQREPVPDNPDGGMGCLVFLA